MKVSGATIIPPVVSKLGDQKIQIRQDSLMVMVSLIKVQMSIWLYIDSEIKDIPKFDPSPFTQWQLAYQRRDFKHSDCGICSELEW
jgi:hypothetical protein